MSALLPGSTLGVIGGGQLARMMAFEARRMGYRVAVLAPDSAEPAVQVADEWIAGSLHDLEAAKRLAASADVVTLDTEHVPASLLATLEDFVPVRPSASVLEIVQDRCAQRRFLDSVGAPQPRCLSIDSLEELGWAVSSTGFPAVLKTRRSGYDGKGQSVIRGEDGIARAWEAVGRQPAMLEEFVEFESEVSALLARNTQGEIRFYPIAANLHREHVLRTTVAPAPIAPSVAVDANEIAARIANALDLVGMLAVEMFLVRGTTLLVNEIAPRPHNSGHFTFGGCVTSQFEQHVRAVFGLPLGDPTQPLPAAMVNLFGDLWHDGEPDWSRVLAVPEARLHLYGKREARPGRKMGHILILSEHAQDALETGETLLEQFADEEVVEPQAPKEAASPR